MRKLLHIGEVAGLLGVTPKAIRHYQKVGLLQEPERSAAGYRLYSAQDLLRLHQICRLQGFGLSLKQIKAVLGEAAQKRPLREVLQALDEELAGQIQELEARRENIRALLDEHTVESVEQLPAISPTFEMVKALLGEQITAVSSELLQQEEEMDALLDAFQWPNGYQEMMRQASHYMVEHPKLYQQLLSLGEQFAALAHLEEDAPEVEQLLEAYGRDETFHSFQQAILALSPGKEEPRYSEMMADILSTALSPAQQRFLRVMQQGQGTQQSTT